MTREPIRPPSSVTTLPRAILGVLALGVLLPAQSWVQRSPGAAPSLRSSSCAFDEARGRAVLFGGYDNTAPALGDTWEWDGDHWLQRTPVAAPSPRWGHRMAYDSQRRRTVLFGGYTPSSGFVGDTWEWNGTTWTQRATPSAPSPRGYHSLAFDRARGRTVLFGGHAGAQSYFSDTWTWNGTSWSLAALATAPGPRRDAAMAYDAVRQETVLFGGGTSAVFADTWAWNGTTWTLRSPATSPPARWASHAVFDTARAKVQLFGGADAAFASNFGDTWEWDGVAWNQLTGTSPSARHGHAMVYDSWRADTLLFGGRDSVSFRGDTWETQPTAPGPGSWQLRSSTGPNARLAAAMACDANGSTYLFGGFHSDFVSPPVLYGDTWRWNGSAWQQIATAGPSNRGGAAMVFDHQRSNTVLFGGFANGPGGSSLVLGDTWLWNGTAWTPAGAGPPARASHRLAFDRARGRVVLFGGVNSTNFLFGDTWEWDGTSWQQKNSASRPTSRCDMAMAFDPVIARTVLHGGRDGAMWSNTSIVGDTWEWDGLSWTLSSNSGPIRAAHVMSFDASRARLVQFGGRDASGFVHGEFWERNGSAWALTPASGPDGLDLSGMDFDSARGRLVLFRSTVPAWTPELWEEVPNGAIQANSLPYGFGCGSPSLALLADPQARPLLGSTPRATIPNAPAGVAFVAMGWNRSSFGGLTIPVPLDGYGLPGCDLLQSADLGAVLGTTAAGASGLQFLLPLPNLPALVGLHLFLQAWAPAPGANAAGAIVSNGVEWRLGNL